MKHILLSLLLLIPCCLTAQENIQARKDSLRKQIALSEGKDKIRNYQLLTTIYFMESESDSLKMDTLLTLYREQDIEALRRKNYVLQGSIRGNIIAAYLNRGEYDKIFQLAPGYLAYLEKHESWQGYYAIYMNKLDAYLFSNNYDKAIEGAQQMYEEAKQRNHNDGKGMALYVMAKAYAYMGRDDEKVKYFTECIETIKDTDTMIWLTATAYAELCNGLISLKRYDEVEQRAKEFEKINYRYEKITKSKQLISWQNLWSVYMDLYFGKGDYDKAESYCDKLDSMSKAPYNQRDVYLTRTKICFERKQYDMALKMLDKASEFTQGDSNHTNEDQSLRLMILCGKKGDMDIYHLFEQAAGLRDSIRNVDFNAKLDELRTVYEVDKVTAQKKKVSQFLFFTIALCLTLAVLLGIYIYYLRLVNKKNRQLFSQIKQQDRLEENLELMTKEYEKILKLIPTSVEEQVVEKDGIKLPGNWQQRELVSRLHDYLLKDNYFAKLDIDINKLISEMATSRTLFFEALKAVTGKTPMEFISALRLDEAKRLLENSNLSTETVAMQCGFNTYSTFYRQFREQYLITPVEYRKLAKSA